MSLTHSLTCPRRGRGWGGSSKAGITFALISDTHPSLPPGDLRSLKDLLPDLYETLEETMRQLSTTGVPPPRRAQPTCYRLHLGAHVLTLARPTFEPVGTPGRERGEVEDGFCHVESTELKCAIDDAAPDFLVPFVSGLCKCKCAWYAGMGEAVTKCMLENSNLRSEGYFWLFLLQVQTGNHR